MSEVGKVAPSAFAEAAGTTDKRVKRHLDAWNRASDMNLCPAATSTSIPGTPLAVEGIGSSDPLNFQT